MGDELSGFVINTLEANLPIIKKYVVEKVGPAAREVIKNDEQMKVIFRTVYNLMPFAVRMAVTENDFMMFAMKNKHVLLDLTENT
ncbi:MAG TPA: hypothetical protein PK079_09380 [Leptospiraceae bacterium]|nr:hypothetical protein [Leptospiraceae bacterium]HMW06429.1 hypothetical protein [Leptospiraceae bacterium]HMX31517.1 hypothetical protein [Leptospiraceae bacterium]HMY31945.1 hypothetical protein [Leptospiraceae bacterium]HMZ63191.1 hypothetical protein [Leptospiraceae bacterium]